VDLKCLHCGGYAQVKTGKHPLTPHHTGWKMPTSPVTVRDTLRKYKGNYDTSTCYMTTSVACLKYVCPRC
jgi:acetone carboxylase gamma subunit